LAGIASLSIVLLGLGLLSLEFPAIWSREHVQTERRSSSAAVETPSPPVTTCFTPAQACADVIVSIVDHAQSQIRLQAYGFTSLPILTALVSAKHRGVDVIVILDKSDDRASSGRSGSGAEFVARAGIPVFVDYRPAIAHNKVSS
jgi:phospholipase D